MQILGIIGQAARRVFKFDATFDQMVTSGPFVGTGICTLSNEMQTVNYTVANADGTDIDNGIFVAGQGAQFDTPWGAGYPAFYAMPGQRRVFEITFNGPVLSGTYPPTYTPGLDGGGPGFNFVRANFWLLEETLAYDVGFGLNVGYAPDNVGNYVASNYGVSVYNTSPYDKGVVVESAPFKVNVVIDGTLGRISIYVNDNFNYLHTYTGIDTTIKRYLVVDAFIQRWLQGVENGKQYSAFVATKAADMTNLFYTENLLDIYGKVVEYTPRWYFTTDRPGAVNQALVGSLDFVGTTLQKSLNGSYITCSPDGQFVAVSKTSNSPGYVIYPASNFVTSGNSLGSPVFSESYFTAYAGKTAFSNNGQYFAAALLNGSSGICLSIRNTADWSELTVAADGAAANALAFSPDSTKLAFHATQYETRVAIYELPGGTRSFLTNVLTAVTDLAFSADGTMLAVCGTANTGLPRVIIYETATWTLLNDIPDADFSDAPTSQANAVVFSPDGKSMYVGRTVTANAWDGVAWFDVIGADPANWTRHVGGGSLYLDTITRIKMSKNGRLMYLRDNQTGINSAGVIKYLTSYGWTNDIGGTIYRNDLDFCPTPFPIP